MHHLNALAAVVACSAIVSSTQAAFITFGNQTLWNQFVTGSGWQVATETFSGVTDGFYAGSYSGSVSSVNWTGSAASGIYAQGGLFSTNNPETLDFVFSPGVQGVGGNIFGTDISFNVVPCIIQVTLADGTSYVNYATTALDFVGFYSTGAAIASMSIQTTATGSGAVYATVDNLYFTVVPAPGSLALLAVAGLGSRGRRRR
jgi:hypothetical protein